MKRPIVVCLLAAGAMLAPTVHAKVSESGAFGTAFQDLAGDDQARFVSTVNLSMAKQDGELDEKSIITLYRVNRDAVKASPPADRKRVLAASFATAPKECLPYFADHFAEDLFTRKAAGFSPDDDSFTEFASAALLRISSALNALQPTDSPGVRSAFAVIMFLKASEGKPEDLRDSFMLYVQSGSREIMRNVWLPAAMGDGNQTPSYRPMMEAKTMGEEPGHNLALPISSPQLTPWLKGDVNVKNNTAEDAGPTPSDDTHAAGKDVGVNRVPRAAISDKDSPYYTHGRDEPHGYVGQTF